MPRMKRRGLPGNTWVVTAGVNGWAAAAA